MPGIDLPSGIKTLNPVPVEFWSGPYTGADETAAKLAANTAIPSAVRFLTMEVSLIIAGIGYKYWYKDGIADLDLVKVDTDISNLVTLNTNQTITGEKTFNGGDLKLQGYDNVNAVSLTYVPGVGTGTVAFPDASGGTAKTIAYRDWVTSQGYITSNAVNSVNGQTGVVVLTTTNISEGSNLYYTSTRANNDFDTRLATKTTSDLTEGTNLYYTNTRFNTDFASKTTTDLGEGSNLYFTNARAIGATLTGYTSGAGTISSADNILQAIQKLNGNIAGLVTGVSSVFGRTGIVTATSGDYNTSQITENTNLYFTDDRARAALSLTTTGTSGAATYNDITGVLNIPEYQGGVTSFNTRTGAITLTSTDVTDALTFTPYNASNPSNYIPLTALSSSATGLTYTNTTGVFSLTSGYVIPTTTQETDWNTAYGWGNHASADYLASSTATSTYIPYSNANTNIDLNAKQLKNVSAFEATSIGIGRSPISKLNVYDITNNSSINVRTYVGGLDIQNGDATTGSYALLRFGNYESNSPSPTGIDGTYIQSITKGNNNTDLAFGNYQTGSGGLINEIMRLTQAGNVGIGTTTPLAKLHISDGNTGGSAFVSSDDLVMSKQGGAMGFNIAVASNASITDRGVFKGTRSRGTLASPTAVASGDYTFSLLGAAYDGSTFRATAGLEMIVDTAPVSNTSVGQAIAFQTGTTSRAERMRITSAGNVGIGTTAPTSKLQIAAGTLADQTMGLKVVGTMPGGTVSSYNRLVDVQATSVNSTSNAYAFNMDFLAGATDANLYAAGRFANNAAGIGTNIFDVSAGLKANLGNLNIAYATTNGHNAGSLNVAWGGNLNVGSAALATTAKNSATNVGVVGLGLNTGTSPIQVGGYFGLQTGTPTFTSAALMADNGGTTSDIFVARDNGTAVFNIKDGGKVGIGTSTPSTLLQLSSNFAPNDGFSMTDTDGGYFKIIQGTGLAGAFQPIFQGYGTGDASSMIFKALRSTTATDGTAGTKTMRFITKESDDSTGIGVNDIAYTFENGSTTLATILGSGNIGIGTTIPYSKLEVSGGIKMSDDTDTASINKVGTLRYRKSGNNTYCEMCMQTGASSYAWIAIIQNNW